MILIPGASGTGESFRPLAPHLISQYQVVIYDRRGLSRSYLDGPQDYEHRLATDADDVRRLIERLTDQLAIVIGLSSGAIVALEVLTQYPERVQTAVAHESPVVSLLPDAAKWWAFFNRIYDSSRKNGIPKAMHQFVSMVVGKESRWHPFLYLYAILPTIVRDSPQRGAVSQEEDRTVGSRSHMRYLFLQ